MEALKKEEQSTPPPPPVKRAVVVTDTKRRKNAVDLLYDEIMGDTRGSKSDSDTEVSTPHASPATKTLDVLSQSTANLLPGCSQVDSSASTAAERANPPPVTPNKKLVLKDCDTSMAQEDPPSPKEELENEATSSEGKTNAKRYGVSQWKGTKCIATYANMREASEATDIVLWRISKSVRTEEPDQHGHHWRRVKHDTPAKPTAVARPREPTTKRETKVDLSDTRHDHTQSSQGSSNVPRSKRVAQIHSSTGEVLRVFESLSAAGRFIGVPASRINRASRNNIEVEGFQWRLARKTQEILGSPNRTSQGIEKSLVEIESSVASTTKWKKSLRTISRSQKSAHQEQQQPVSLCNSETRRVIRRCESLPDTGRVSGESIGDDCLQHNYGGYNRDADDLSPSSSAQEPAEKRVHLQSTEKNSIDSERPNSGLQKNCAIHQLQPNTLKVLSTFGSLREAHKATSISRHAISKACQSECIAGGFQWRKVSIDQPVERVSSTTPDDVDADPQRLSAASSVHTKGSKNHDAVENLDSEAKEDKQLSFPSCFNNDFVKASMHTIEAPGKLGGSISNEMEVDEVIVDSLGRQGITPKKLCSVVTTKQGGQLDMAGIRGGDLLLLVQNNTLVGDYNDIKAAISSETRPITFCGLRKLQDEVEPREVSQSHLVASAREKLREATVPFCAMCNGRSKRAVHHVWCPLSPQHKSSGADSVMTRIKEGINLGCPLCSTEFLHGKAPKAQDINHTEPCLKNQAALLLAEKSSQESNQMIFSDDGCGDSDQSVYRHSSPQRRQLVSSKGKTTEKSTYSQQQVQRSCTEKRKRDTGDSRKKVKSTGKARSAPSKKGKKVSTQMQRDRHEKENIESRNIQDHFKGPTTSRYEVRSETDDNYDSDESSLDIAWSPCHNPWGVEEMRIDDIIVSAPDNRLCSVEAEDVSPRFVHDPFSTSSNYLKTHSSPPSGLLVLILKRDLRSKLPWGFRFEKHEFGGACLVTSVAPFSPADKAVFLGMQTGDSIGAGLREHDMIVAINGRDTGGMTMSTFEVEMDLTGNSLMLVVSRYRYLSMDRGEGQRRVRQADLQLASSQSILGWIDVGQNEHNPARNYDDSASMAVTTERRPSANTFEEGNPACQTNNTGEHVSDSQSIMSTRSSREATSTKEIAASARQTIEEERQCVVAEIDQSDPCSQKPRTRHQRALEQDDDQNWEDDTNAWCNCVCGSLHSSKPVFWIQCEACASWFNVYRGCVGFDEEEAKEKEKWHCWGCETSDMIIDDSDEKQAANEETSRQNEAVTTIEMGQREETNTQESNDSDHDDLATTFKPGDLIQVEEHGWAGVNTAAGIAKITKVHRDEDGDLVYDIKYVIGGRVKNVLPKYVSSFCF